SAAAKRVSGMDAILGVRLRRWSGDSGPSFETAAARPPQDEDHIAVPDGPRPEARTPCLQGSRWQRPQGLLVDLADRSLGQRLDRNDRRRHLVFREIGAAMVEQR